MRVAGDVLAHRDDEAVHAQSGFGKTARTESPSRQPITVSSSLGAYESLLKIQSFLSVFYFIFSKTYSKVFLQSFSSLKLCFDAVEESEERHPPPYPTSALPSALPLLPHQEPCVFLFLACTSSIERKSSESSES